MAPTDKLAFAAGLPLAVALPTLIAVLAGMDILAGLIAKSWSEHHSAGVLVMGIGLYAVAFIVYAITLQYGSLSMVTLAWVVIVTVADMIIDRFWFDVQLPVTKWIAMLIAVAALIYIFSDHSSV